MPRRPPQVLDRDQLEQIRPYLESIEPMPAVFDQHYVKRLTGKKVKTGKNKCDLANQIRNGHRRVQDQGPIAKS